MQTLLGSPRAARRGARRLRRTLDYLAATETHTYATSVAAYALLSFFPFIVLLLTLTRNFLQSGRLYHSLLQLLRAYLPVANVGDLHTQEFILRNLQVIVEHQEVAQYASLVILLVTCTGVFMPLEVALNRIWGAARNRSYLRNWAVAIGLAFACGVLGMLSASFTALTETYSARLYRFLSRTAVLHGRSVPLDVFSIAVVRAGAIPFTIALFFLIYWRLPNRRVPVRRVLPAAVLAGVLWEISKYVYILLLPWLDFQDLYGPFAISVTLLLWAYVSALILLLCAQVWAPAAEPSAQIEFHFEQAQTGPALAGAAAESLPPTPPAGGEPEAAAAGGPEAGKARV